MTIRLPEGRLAVLLPGMGAVATTFIAGVLLARRGLGEPIGSLTQLGRMPDGRPLGSALPLASLGQLEFGGWDLFPDDAFLAAQHAGVLEAGHLEPIRSELSRVRPMPAVFYPQYVRRLHGTHLKRGDSKADLVEQVRADIRTFLQRRECNRAVAVWCGSTEVHVPPGRAHESIESFELGLRQNDPGISNAQIYAWACLQERVPFANGAPHLGIDFPAAVELAMENGVPIAGKDLKTGPAMMKAVIAPALAARRLGLSGWFSTSILGNRDGEVLDDPDSFRSKEISKLGVLEPLLSAQDSPGLYGNLFHKVRIEYYPPRGDAKEAWDNIDLFGWMGYPMQLKVNFLCRDSILAAPVVLDLALWLDLAQRAGLRGPQDWLSFYFESPMAGESGRAASDFFEQHRRLLSAAQTLSARAGHDESWWEADGEQP